MNGEQVSPDGEQVRATMGPDVFTGDSRPASAPEDKWQGGLASGCDSLCKIYFP